MKIGELVLFPAVRNHTEDGIIAAPGTSCRHQVKDGTGKRLNTLWKFYTKHFIKSIAAANNQPNRIRNMQKPVLVIKLGSAVITKPGGTVDKIVIKKKISSEIAALSKERRVVLLSPVVPLAGGKSALKRLQRQHHRKKGRSCRWQPDTHTALSQIFLSVQYKSCAGIVRTSSFSNRTQFLQLKETFTTFWEMTFSCCKRK